MKLQCYSAEFAGLLADQVEANLVRYSGSSQWVDELARTGGRIRESGIEIKELPRLQMPHAGEFHEAENARRLHAALNKLSPLEAMDHRLWICLSHTFYWDYVQARWPPGSAGQVLDRFLFGGTDFGSLVRNGISRLWWFGHLTFDKNRANPYELMDTLLCNQDIQQALLQRSFGKSRIVLHTVLDHIRINRDTLYARAIGDKIKEIAKPRGR